MRVFAARVQRQQQQNEKASGEESDGENTEQLLPVGRPPSPDRRGARYFLPAVSWMLEDRRRRRRVATGAISHLDTWTDFFLFLFSVRLLDFTSREILFRFVRLRSLFLFSFLSRVARRLIGAIVPRRQGTKLKFLARNGGKFDRQFGVCLLDSTKWYFSFSLLCVVTFSFSLFRCGTTINWSN